jgi:hypothetical protein
MPASPLGAPLDLPCGQRLANRIAKSAMTEALAARDDAPGAAHAMLYRRWSRGGMAPQVTGNVMIDRRYLERPGNVVVEDRRDLGALRDWAAAGKSGGSRIWMQISHPGRQCPVTVARRPLSPSAERLRILGLFGTPREMTEADIEEAPPPSSRGRPGSTGYRSTPPMAISSVSSCRRSPIGGATSGQAPLRTGPDCCAVSCPPCATPWAPGFQWPSS